MVLIHKFLVHEANLAYISFRELMGNIRGFPKKLLKSIY